MYIDRQTLDCSVNYQIYTTEMAEAEKIGDAAIKKVNKPAYKTDNEAFMTMCQTIALSTVAFFQFIPDMNRLK